MKSIKRAYYYLFYKLYKFSEAAPSRWLSAFKAGAVVVVLEVCLFLSMMNYYNVFINRNFELNETYAIIIVLIIASFNYYTFAHTDAWKKYAKQFNQLPKRTNFIGSMIVFSIVLVVIANLIISFYLMSQVDWINYRK